MITDNETNFVFFSNLLPKDFKDQSKLLTDVLDKYKVGYGFLKSTKDYYCRDYMPVQVELDKLIQFVFHPLSYFTAKDYPYLTNQNRVMIDNKLKQPHFSRLILDGGNVVKGKNKVIITDKVLTDNRYQLSDAEIIKELGNLFNAEIIIIPAIPGDDTGHADGMIRFIDDERVLINSLGIEENETWENNFIKTLTDHNLKYEEFPVFDVDEADGAVGIYINYLQVGNVILLPIFDHPKQKNDQAIKVISGLFPDYIIEPVNANVIATEGGVFNCCSWNIKV